MSDPISDKQLRWLQQLWTARQRDGMICGATGKQFAGDEREQRLAWARDHLGQARLTSFSTLTMTAAAYLLDILNGKPTKLDAKIQELLAQRDIPDPTAWFEAFQAKANMWKFRGAALHQLNRWQKIELVNVLASRGDESPRAYSRDRARWHRVPRDVSPGRNDDDLLANCVE